MKRAAYYAVFLATFAFAGPAYSLSLTLENNSGTALQELYFSPSGQDTWGPDQLGEGTVESGGTYTLANIQAGKYDLKFVSPAGDACILPDVNFQASEIFEMTPEIMGGCAKATEEQGHE